MRQVGRGLCPQRDDGVAPGHSALPGLFRGQGPLLRGGGPPECAGAGPALVGADLIRDLSCSMCAGERWSRASSLLQSHPRAWAAFRRSELAREPVGSVDVAGPSRTESVPTWRPAWRPCPLPNPLPEGRGDRSEKDETTASTGTICPLSRKRERGRSEQDETMVSADTIGSLSLRSGARSQGWGEGKPRHGFSEEDRCS